MGDVENQVRKHLISFSKILPQHVDFWKSVLQESAKPLQTLSNLCEQQRHVRRCKLLYVDNFEDVQAALQYQIANRIEEELTNLKELIDKLSKSNNDLKNKLFTLEKSTLDLDWEKKTELIRGNGTQPSLSRLLQDGLAFSIFFSKCGRTINDHFKEIDLNDEKSVKELQASFDVDLNSKVVTNLIAITQYIDNEKAVL